MSTLILTHEQITKKTERIAYQILEDNIDETSITLVGIANTGFEFASTLATAIKNISELEVVLLKLKIDKRNSIQALDKADSLEIEKDTSVILVDDVLNSGETLINSSFIILRHGIKKLRTAVIIDRRHRLFPIKADFAGLTLSTTLEEHIEIEYKNETFTATLD